MAKIEFTTASDKEVANFPAERTYLDKPEGISPLNAYIALRALFDEPDTEHLDEDKMQWRFQLKTADAAVEVYDWKQRSFSVCIYQKDNDELQAKAIAHALSQLIVQTANKNKGKIAAIIAKPSGFVLENPFALQYKTADDLLKLSQQFANDDMDEPRHLDNFDTSDLLCRAAYVQFIAAVEGFLNLLVELYLRHELRDERIVERFGREQIDIKLRLIPLYCDCFVNKVIDGKNEVIQDFMRIINMRNNFIHANFTKSMRTPFVTHEGAAYFISPEKKSTHPLTVDSLSEITLDFINNLKAVVDGVINYLLSNMHPRERKVFSDIMYEDFIHVSLEDGVPVIL